jgi:hypothetical protein
MTLVKTLRRLFAASLVAAALGASFGAAAADKPRIEREADIPRFSYTIKQPLLEVVRDKALFDAATAPIRADISSVLSGYEIADKAAQRQMMLTLVQLDFLAGNYDAAAKGAEAVRALEEKPADKLLSGLRLRAMAAAARETGGVNTPAYAAAVARIIRKDRWLSLRRDRQRYPQLQGECGNHRRGWHPGQRQGCAAGHHGQDG